jgi:hypothetical protein
LKKFIIEGHSLEQAMELAEGMCFKDKYVGEENGVPYIITQSEDTDGLIALGYVGTDFEFPPEEEIE